MPTDKKNEVSVGFAEKPYDLEDRTQLFARDVIAFTSVAPRTLANTETLKQLVRAAGSVGANYIEAREPLGDRDLAMRLRICRKEAKEARYWLSLVETSTNAAESQRAALSAEATALLKIFNALVDKVR